MTRINRYAYAKSYPAVLVFADGSTINVRYHEPRAIIKVVLLLVHLLNGLFYRTTWLSQYQKGKTSLDLNKVRNDGDGSGIS